MAIDWSRVFDVKGPVGPLLWMAVLAVALFALIWATLRLRAWFRDDAADSDNAIDLLSDMRELHRQGGLTEEEFRLIKTRLAQAATGGGASRTKVSSPSRPLAAKAADLAAPKPAALSLQGRSDPPDEESIGPTATDAAVNGQLKNSLDGDGSAPHRA